MAKLSQDIVLRYLSLVSGTFHTRQIWQELNIITPEAKAHLRVILQRLCESGVLSKTDLDGTYYKYDTKREELDWQSANIDNVLPVILPIRIHEYCKLYPKSIVIVAGGKNSGKTAFLLECLRLNMYYPAGLDFYNSETGPEQLKERLTPLGIPTPAPFKTYARYDHFSDVIEPDKLTVIDYLDLNSEVYLVGEEIDKIFRKLTTGCVIIGMQKPPATLSIYKGEKKYIERDLAYGGAFTAKRASLYISLGQNRCKLVYVKTPLNPKVNPTNKQWSYGFSEFGYFTNIKDYHEPMEGFI